jgi:hypothetical protein
MRASEINRTAEIYFAEHTRELLEVAWKKVKRSPDLMRFYEKEQRDDNGRLSTFYPNL